MRIQAKSLVRVRGQIGKLQASIAQLKGVSTQMTVRRHRTSFCSLVYCTSIGVGPTSYSHMVHGIYSTVYMYLHICK